MIAPPITLIDRYNGQKRIDLVEKDNVLFKANTVIPLQSYVPEEESTPIDVGCLGHIHNKTGTNIGYDILFVSSKGTVMDTRKNNTVRDETFEEIQNKGILTRAILPPNFKNWEIVLRVTEGDPSAGEGCFAWAGPNLLNYTLTQSSTPTEIPGNILKVKNPPEKILYFVLWINDEPVGQTVVTFRNNAWWGEHSFLRKDMRDKYILIPFLRMSIEKIREHTDFIWMKIINMTPDDATRRENFGITRKIISVSYQGSPLSLKRWAAYKEAKGLSSKGFVATIRDDLRTVIPIPPAVDV